MRPYAQFTWSRPIRRPNGVRTTSSSPTVRPAATFQHVLRPMEAAAARRKRLVPAADQAWQGASPLQRRLAVATATTLRRPPHPLRRTGAAQHHLSPMRASSAKRDNAGGERARAAKSSMVSVPEGLTLGTSGLVSRQMKRGDRWRPCRRSRFAHLRRNALNARPGLFHEWLAQNADKALTSR